MERDRIAEAVKAKLSRGRFARPRSPAWTVGEDLVTVSTPSGRTVSRSNCPLAITPIPEPMYFSTWHSSSTSRGYFL